MTKEIFFVHKVTIFGSIFFPKVGPGFGYMEERMGLGCLGKGGMNCNDAIAFLEACQLIHTLFSTSVSGNERQKHKM